MVARLQARRMGRLTWMPRETALLREEEIP